MMRRLIRRLEDGSGLFRYLWPLMLYCLVGGLCGAAVDLVWESGFRDLAAGALQAPSAYAVRTSWPYLRIVLAAGAGFWSIRGAAHRELFLFAQFFYKKAEDAMSGEGEEASVESLGTVQPEGSGAAMELPLVMDRPMLPVLLIFTVSLSLGINVAAALFEKAAGTSLIPSVPDAPPGPVGILLQAAVFGLYMPFIEELLFRGTLFSRMERELGFRRAALASSALFGLYHGNPVQALYGFLMGAVFSLAYESTGRIRIPFALHGACNLAVLSLQWTGAFRNVCTPGWEAAFLCIAAAGAFTLRRMNLPDL